MAHHHRDPWEIDDEPPPIWEATILKRARDLGNQIDQDTRWALFALRAVINEIAALPDANCVRWIALAGPLANGVAGERIQMAVIVLADIPYTQQATLWSDLNTLLTKADRTYAQQFDCLFLSETEIGHPTNPPLAWQAIAHDHLIVWP